MTKYMSSVSTNMYVDKLDDKLINTKEQSK